MLGVINIDIKITKEAQEYIKEKITDKSIILHMAKAGCG